MSVLFILSEPDGLELLQSRGFEGICLHNSYQEKEQEVEQLLEICRQKNITHLLVDSYEVTPTYLQRLRDEMVVCYLDDLQKFVYPVDVLINYTFGIQKQTYIEQGYDEKTQFLFGSTYTPLRHEFAAAPIKIKKRCENLLITTGGSDPYQISLLLAKALKQNKSTEHLHLHIIAGKFYQNVDELQQFAAQEDQVSIYQNVTNMAEIMQRCDLAVSAGGTTLAELCACGVPTIAFTMADNQMAGTKAYADAGILCYAGDARNGGLVEKLEEAICALKDDVEKRAEMSRLGHQCVDGKGAGRITEAIAMYNKKN
ncbi:MAG: UDP-2,4-diacetamido-2,4,6-trideoxy-beta-L-altropyranose hydrolase [Lachnospiraceae bacterium]